jgi:hypothetical protein
VAIALETLPGDWDQIRVKHGLVAGPAWGKFACPSTYSSRAAPISASARLSRKTPLPGSGSSTRGFGLRDPDLSPMLAAALEDPVAHVFGAWDDDLLVGAGAVHLFGDVASINTGGTLPSYRGRGIQSALTGGRSRRRPGSWLPSPDCGVRHLRGRKSLLPQPHPRGFHAPLRQHQLALVALIECHDWAWTCHAQSLPDCGTPSPARLWARAYGRVTARGQDFT